MSEEVHRITLTPVLAPSAGAGARPAPPPAERPRAPAAAPAPQPTAVQLSEFLAHELAAPVGVVTGALYLLQREPLEGYAAELAARAFSAAREMTETVDDLRALAGAVRPGEVSAAAAAAQAVEAVTAAAPRVKMAFRACPPAPGARVLGHAGLVRRAVRNLVQNAVEAAGPGGRVGVVVRAAGDRVRITVWDDGPGVPPEHAESVFLRPFTTRPGGTGLGLLLVRSVAAALGGSVSLRPRAPRGSLFRIDLPRAPTAGAAG